MIPMWLQRAFRGEVHNWYCRTHRSSDDERLDNITEQGHELDEGLVGREWKDETGTWHDTVTCPRDWMEAMCRLCNVPMRVCYCRSAQCSDPAHRTGFARGALVSEPATGTAAVDSPADTASTIPFGTATSDAFSQVSEGGCKCGIDHQSR